MKSTAKHEAQQPQHEEEPAKNKSRKKPKSKQTAAPQSKEDTSEPPPMVSAPVTETADSSESWTHCNALSLSDTPCNAAQEASNEIEKAHAIFLNEFKRHSHQHNVAEMVQMLDMTAATVPFDSHELLKARDKLTAATQAPGTRPSNAAMQQFIRQGPTKPNSSVISRRLCAWARHARARIPGLTFDATGRLSLNNIMRVWGAHQGLCANDIVQAIHLHTPSENGPRYTTQATHDDLYIQVRPAKNSSHSSHHEAYVAPQRPWRRDHD